MNKVPHQKINWLKLRETAGFLSGVVFGGLAGVAAALLLAPRSGEKTRVQISEQSILLQERAADTYNELVTLSHFDNRKVLAQKHS